MLTVIGDAPTSSAAEAVQFERVIAILQNCQDRIGPWGYLILDHGFAHARGDIIDVDHDWNGQIDILLIAPHRIAIYELKGFTVTIIYGTTGSGQWKIRRAAAGEEEASRSFFLQASEQRAFVLRDFLHKFHERHPEYAHNHWVVDARVVFKDGSDLSGFFYGVPLTEMPETLEHDVLPLVSTEEDKAFVRSAFSARERGTNKLQRAVWGSDLRNLRRIYQENGIRPRTSKWFRVITEEQIPADLADIGSDRMLIDRECANLMIEELRSTAWVYNPTGSGPP